MTRSRFWMIVAVVGCIAILAAGWFFGASPQLDAKAAADTQREVVDAQNAAQSIKTAKLKQDFDNIAATRKELATLRAALPDGTAYPDLLDYLADIAAAHSVQIVQYSSDEPISPIALQAAIVPDPSIASETDAADPTTTAATTTDTSTTGAAATDTSTTDTSTTDTSTTGAAATDTSATDSSTIGGAPTDASTTDSSTTESAANDTSTTDSAAGNAGGAGDSSAIPETGAAVAEPSAVREPASSLLTAKNLFAVPMTLSLEGSPTDILAMIADLQSGERLFLVTSTQVGAEDFSEVKGYVFVVTDAQAVVVPAADLGVAPSADDGTAAVN